MEKAVTSALFRMPDWVKRSVDEWAAPAGITSGPLFRAINKAGRVSGNGFTPKVIWSIVKEGAVGCGLTGLAPHDLRRTCARLCHQAGGELETDPVSPRTRFNRNHRTVSGL